jgi:hypothetical protein
MTSRLARAIVEHYPLAWRERYADEVLALLDDSQVRLIDLFELARGLFVERAKSLIEPVEHPTLTDWGFRAVAGLIGIAPAVTLVAGGAALGGQLARWLGEPSDVVSMIAVAICLTVVVVDIGARRLFRVELSRAANVGLALAICGFMVTWHWGFDAQGSGPARFSTSFYWAQMYIYAMVAHRLLGSRFPWRPMFDAVERYQEALQAVRRAQADVDRCLASTERLAQWHLQPALDTLAQCEQERDEARAIVDTYGYRARFQQA